jgi:hypothetical protein
MLRILSLISLLSAFFFLYAFIFPNVYGNGIRNNFGIDYLPPLNLDESPLSLNVEFNPSMTKSDINETRSLIFRLIDIDKNITYVPNYFNITILKNDLNNGNITEKRFLNGSFFSKNGTLILEFDSNKTNIINNNTNKFNKYNIDKNNNNKVVQSDENGVVVIEKPSLDSGFYRLKVDVKLYNNTSYGSNTKKIDLKFDSYLSLGNILDLDVGNPAKKITVLSFNDKIIRFHYDQQSKKILFEIPFKYNMTRIEEGFIYLHMEIKIPNTINEFFNAKEFLTTINDIDHSEISSASVSVDRYSNSSSVIIHFILDSNSLFKLTKERQVDPEKNSDMTLKFSLQPKLDKKLITQKKAT